MAERSSKPKHSCLKIAVAAILLSVVIACGGLVYLWLDSHTPSYFGPGPIEIQIVPDKPVFLQGENVTFKVTIINNQSWPVMYPNFKLVNITRNGVHYDSTGMFIDYSVKAPTYPAKANTTHNTHLEMV